MSTQQAAPSPGRANLVLATLFSGMFVLGGAELLVVGVLNLIAADLRASIPAASALVSANALGPRHRRPDPDGADHQVEHTDHPHRHAHPVRCG